MKTNIMSSIKGGLLSLSAAGILLASPAFADDKAAKQAKDYTQAPEFSSLDANSNQQIEQNELQDLAQRHGKEAEQMIQKYDQNGDQSLDQSEFSQLSGNLPQAGDQPRTAQAGESAKPTITVDQKPAQITVKKPAPQVTVQQAKPTVTITTQDPKVQVEQGEPKVSVQQAKPEVSVDQAEPEVAIEDAQPQVQVLEAEPEVQLEQSEPQVSVQEEPQQQTQMTQEQQTSMQQPSTANTSQPIQAMPSAEQEAPTGIVATYTLYSVPIEDLRTSRVMDSAGQQVGQVEDVVVKRDGSEAGLVVSLENAEGQSSYVFAPVEEVTLVGDALVWEGAAQAAEQAQPYNPSDFESAPGSARTLSDVVSGEEVSSLLR